MFPASLFAPHLFPPALFGQTEGGAPPVGTPPVLLHVSVELFVTPTVSSELLED